MPDPSNHNVLLQTNAKKVLAIVVPRRTGGPIRNLKEDDPRLQAIQDPIMAKLDKLAKKLSRHHNQKGGQIRYNLDQLTSRYYVAQGVSR